MTPDKTHKHFLCNIHERVFYGAGWTTCRHHTVLLGSQPVFSKESVTEKEHLHGLMERRPLTGITQYSGGQR